MKAFLQKNRPSVFALILAALILVGLFYWFQIRPVEIKKGCSWVERHTGDLSYSRYLQEMGLPADSSATSTITAPDAPPKTYYVAANPAQYSFCFHSHGL